MSGTDAFVQVAADGAGKKIATEEFTRNDGSVVEQQLVLPADPVTGRPLDAPPWAEFDGLLRLVLVELRLQTSLIATEFRITEHDVDMLRNGLIGDIK